MNANGPLSRDAERQLAQQRRVEEEAARRRRFDAARARVRSFAGKHTDIAAMALIMLEWGDKPVTQTAIRERVNAQYPGTFS